MTILVTFSNRAGDLVYSAPDHRDSCRLRSLVAISLTAGQAEAGYEY